MHIEIIEEDFRGIAAYASISIAFEVAEEVITNALAEGSVPAPLRTRRVAAPYRKDYDAVPGNNPFDWPARFDISGWGLLAAYAGSLRVGGAIVVANDRQIELLEGRDDAAVLWDLRIVPAFRRRGVASALLAAAEHWARVRGSRVLAVETQHINVPACRFYGAHGFVISAINEAAYAESPDEVQLIWSKRLLPAADANEQRS